MKNFNVVSSYISDSFRSLPVTFFYIQLLNLVINPSKSFFYDIMFIFFGGWINSLFKKIARIIYNKLNVKSLPLIGIGERPKGAYGCSSFLSVDDIKNETLSSSYGMPSGHSQLAWLIIGYYGYDIFYSNSSFRDMQLSLLILFGLTMAYMRTKVEGCHTIGQVIVGAIIGLFMGIIGKYIKKKYFRKYL